MAFLGDNIKDHVKKSWPEELVADASALIGGLPYSGVRTLFISPLVEAELQGLEGFDLLRAANMEVREPSEVSVEKVEQAAMETGDDARVSEADVEILALALEIGLPILTDDYSIQNLAKHMGMVFIPVGEKGISRIIEWTYRCKGCGKYFNDRVETCPVCGSDVRSARKKAL